MVEVSIVVNDTQCVATCVVNATADGSSGSSMNSTVPVSGLDLCEFSYSFVGYVVTPGGVAGGMSDAFEFTANLSGITSCWCSCSCR